jgi:hypothetical protein
MYPASILVNSFYLKKVCVPKILQNIKTDMYLTTVLWHLLSFTDMLFISTTHCSEKTKSITTRQFMPSGVEKLIQKCSPLHIHDSS